MWELVEHKYTNPDFSQKGAEYLASYFHLNATMLRLAACSRADDKLEPDRRFNTSVLAKEAGISSEYLDRFRAVAIDLDNVETTLSQGQFHVPNADASTKLQHLSNSAAFPSRFRMYRMDQTLD
jgi:hypothetical protein